MHASANAEFYVPPVVPSCGKAGMLREAWVNYQTISDEGAKEKTRTILNISILPFALQLGQGFWYQALY